MPEFVTCARCGASFGCGAREAYCWCAELPPLDVGEWSAGDDRLPASCLCAACLRAALAGAVVSAAPAERGGGEKT